VTLRTPWPDATAELFIEDISVMQEDMTVQTLGFYRIPDSDTEWLARWEDHHTREIREQVVNVPNTRTWRETTKRHMLERHPNVHVPTTLLPRPNKRKAPYA
jgi:hypothetical protein